MDPYTGTGAFTEGGVGIDDVVLPDSDDVLEEARFHYSLVNTDLEGTSNWLSFD